MDRTHVDRLAGRIPKEIRWRFRRRGIRSLKDISKEEKENLVRRLDSLFIAQSLARRVQRRPAGARWFDSRSSRWTAPATSRPRSTPRRPWRSWRLKLPAASCSRYSQEDGCYFRRSPGTPKSEKQGKPPKFYATQPSQICQTSETCQICQNFLTNANSKFSGECFGEFWWDLCSCNS